jgi:hypothetical protein
MDRPLHDPACAHCGAIRDPEDTLQQLFDLLLADLCRRVGDPKSPPALLNVARAFLQDCGITETGRAGLSDGLRRVRDRRERRKRGAM